MPSTRKISLHQLAPRQNASLKCFNTSQHSFSTPPTLTMTFLYNFLINFTLFYLLNNLIKQTQFPSLIGIDSADNIAQQITEAEAKAPEDLTEEDKMILLGRPKNGDIIRAQLRIKESKEFKVSRSVVGEIVQIEFY